MKCFNGPFLLEILPSNVLFSCLKYFDYTFWHDFSCLISPLIQPSEIFYSGACIFYLFHSQICFNVKQMACGPLKFIKCMYPGESPPISSDTLIKHFRISDCKKHSVNFRFSWRVLAAQVTWQTTLTYGFSEEVDDVTIIISHTTADVVNCLY